LYFDGTCPGNGTPEAHGGWGWSLQVGGEERDAGAGPVAGKATSNVAEYEALIAALRALLHKAAGLQSVTIRGDSQLIINQVNGHWSCNAPHLRRQLALVENLVRDLSAKGVDLCFEWIPRDQNGRADELADVGLEAIQKDILPF
jgi:ribonuclease HI